jgi:phage terminase small subunit
MRNAPVVPAFNNRQAAFVDHVLTGCSATVAAQRAGYSDRSARQIATRLLSKAAIRGEIQARQGGSDSQRLQMERQDVIAGLLEAIGIARERRAASSRCAGSCGTPLAHLCRVRA